MQPYTGKCKKLTTYRTKILFLCSNNLDGITNNFC